MRTSSAATFVFDIELAFLPFVCVRVLRPYPFVLEALSVSAVVKLVPVLEQHVRLLHIHLLRLHHVHDVDQLLLAL